MGSFSFMGPGHRMTSHGLGFLWHGAQSSGLFHVPETKVRALAAGIRDSRGAWVSRNAS